MFIAENLQAVVYGSYGGQISHGDENDNATGCNLPGVLGDEEFVYVTLSLRLESVPSNTGMSDFPQDLRGSSSAV